MSVLAKSAYFWRSARHGLQASPFVHFIAVITLAIALFTAGLLRGGLSVVDAALQQLGGEIEVTAYLDDSVTPGQATALAGKWSSQAQVRVVAPDEALSRLAWELGDLGAVFAQLPKNPLPRSLELRLPPQARSREGLRAMATALRAEPGVTAVDYGEEAVDRLTAIARALKYGGLVAFLIAAIATTIIVSATLQLAIYSRREEIEIQKLVGATDRFVKIPFLIEGLFQGVIGALLALGVLAACSAFLGGPLSAAFAFLLGPGGAPPLITGTLVAELMGAGCLLGLFGSFVAVGRFLRI
ncbi:MAG: cell division protein FtsX [Myxococcaceae bacterium]